MGFDDFKKSTDNLTYEVNSNDIEKAQEKEKEIFEKLPKLAMITSYWEFFESVHTFFRKICESRLKIYKDKKEAIKNSYFYKNVHDKLGEKIETVGGGNKNTTNRQLKIGEILNCSWPPNNSSTFKKEYRRKLKEIATDFLKKNKKAYETLSYFGICLKNQLNRSNNENSSIKSENIQAEKTSFKFNHGCL